MIATNIGPEVERIDVGGIERLRHHHTTWSLFVETQLRSTEIDGLIRWAFGRGATDTLEGNIPEMGCGTCMTTQFERRHCRQPGHLSNVTQDDTNPGGLGPT